MRHNLREIIGLIIWWTEGTKAYKDKRGKNTWVYNVDVTNTNPEIIKLFLDFLRKDVKIDESRLKLQLQIHKGDDQCAIENYWSNLTNIPKQSGNKRGKKSAKADCRLINAKSGACLFLGN